MNFEIRPAELHDAPAIALVQVESWKSTYSGLIPESFLSSLDAAVLTRMWQKQLSVRNLLQVAVDASGVFGFASGGEAREAPEDYRAEIYAIYLRQDRQRQGVGRGLIRVLADGFEAQNLHGMMVWVLEANPAVSFYKHLGGVQIGRKLIEIGGVSLPELAFGWPSLDELASPAHSGLAGGPGGLVPTG